MGPCKACAFGLGGAAVVSLVLGAETQPIKKQRGGRGLGLGGCRSGWENTTTSQKLAFAVGSEDIGEGTRPRWNVWGERFAILWGGERKTKK